jgi:hypothetical protein
MASRGRSDFLLTIPGLALIAGALLVIAFAIGLYVVKSGERSSYRGIMAGDPCPALHAIPAGFSGLPLKRFAFEDLQLEYPRGNVDCETTRQGRLLHDAEIPYCAFENPGYVAAAQGSAKTYFLLAVGEAVITPALGGVRCIAKRG